MKAILLIMLSIQIMTRRIDAFSTKVIRRMISQRRSIKTSIRYSSRGAGDAFTERPRLEPLLQPVSLHQHGYNGGSLDGFGFISHRRSKMSLLKRSMSNYENEQQQDVEDGVGQDIYDTLDDDDDGIRNEGDIDEEEEKFNPILERAQHLQSSLQATNDKLLKKTKSLQNELDKAKQLESTMKRANLIISNLYQLPPGTESSILQDWEEDEDNYDNDTTNTSYPREVEIIFNTKEYNSPQEEADALFTQARKMKRGSAILKNLLLDSNEHLQIIQDAIIDVEYAMTEETNNADEKGEGEIQIDQGRIELILERLERSSSKTGFVMKQDNTKNNRQSSPKRQQQKKQSRGYQPSFRKFKSPNGCLVLVGKNRRDNEAICFQVSKPTDIWFHARGSPGAHVLLQSRRGSPKVTQQCMQFAANLAAFYSDARTERKAAITTASPKHIQKPRGAPPGAVKLREELNTITGYPEDVDEILKLKREESGVIWDESGKRSLGGKAKNKKRTKEVLKQNIAKKRADDKKERRSNRLADESNEFW